MNQMYYKAPTFLIVQDDEGQIAFQREDLMRYSGARGLIASGVVLRLILAASEDLCPGSIPFRKEFKFRTSFPGDEVRDGIELVTRAVTQGRFTLDLSIGPDFAPATPAGGRMYFEVAYKDEAMSYVLDPSIFTQQWLEEVVRHQEGSVSKEAHAKYLEYKYQILGMLLSRPEVFTQREPVSIDRFK